MYILNSLCQQRLTWLTICWTEVVGGYINNAFIADLFLIRYLTFSEVCLLNFKFGVGSRLFAWEEGEPF